MAEKEEMSMISNLNLAGTPPADSKQNSRPSSAKGKDISHADREERLRVLKEKQTEERQRKLDELKNQALAAQKFREQKEEERRKRMEELRSRDTDRRHQVEERKRQIWEADKERREAILRKNQEREAKIESKRKNDRSSMIFAFGSSTPRMLEPGDTVPYWSTRRATSTTNVMTMSLSAATPGPLTRRSSERELDGSKKRATSAGGMERKPHLDDPDSLQLGPGWRKDAARRRTDLTPTIPLKELNRTSLGKKSSPGRAFSMSRLDILAAPRRPKIAPLPELEPIQQTNKKNTTYRSMSVLPGSDKGSKGATVKGAKSMLHLGPTPPPRLTRAEKLRKKAREMAKTPESPGPRSGEQTPSRPLSSMSQHSVASNLSSASASLRSRSSLTTRRPRPISIAVTGVTSDPKNLDKSIKSPSGMDRPPIPKVHSATKKNAPKPENVPKKPQEKLKSGKSSTVSSPNITPIESPIIEIAEPSPNLITQEEVKTEVEKKVKDKPVEIKAECSEIFHLKQEEVTNAQTDDKRGSAIETKLVENGTDLSECDMTASMISKTRITTEEEAKAALAERRRLAREQVEREAELEKIRLENERIAEEERIRKEEEDQRRMEEEQLRLLEEARKSEEIRLQEAIEEARKRDEEEKKRKEEELRLKIEKEEADKKAKEEAEKMRIEMEIRLKKEEEDRQARRKRVEAIMSRTRASKGSLNASQSKDGDDDDVSPPDGIKKTPDSVGSEIDQFIESERSHSDANTTQISNNKHNGNHQNGSYNSINENNVTNTLLDLAEDEVRILDLDTGKIVPEQPQFIPYQDKKEPPTVNDLLS